MKNQFGIDWNEDTPGWYRNGTLIKRLRAIKKGINKKTGQQVEVIRSDIGYCSAGVLREGFWRYSPPPPPPSETTTTLPPLSSTNDSLSSSSPSSSSSSLSSTSAANQESDLSRVFLSRLPPMTRLLCCKIAVPEDFPANIFPKFRYLSPTASQQQQQGT